MVKSSSPSLRATSLRSKGVFATSTWTTKAIEWLERCRSGNHLQESPRRTSRSILESREGSTLVEQDVVQIRSPGNGSVGQGHRWYGIATVS